MGCNFELLYLQPFSSCVPCWYCPALAVLQSAPFRQFVLLCRPLCWTTRALSLLPPFSFLLCMWAGVFLGEGWEHSSVSLCSLPWLSVSQEASACACHGQEPNPQPVLVHRVLWDCDRCPMAAGAGQRDRMFSFELWFWDVLKSSVNQLYIMLFSKDAEIKDIFPKKGKIFISRNVFYLKATMKHHYLLLQRSWRNSQAIYQRGLKTWFQPTLIKPLLKRFVTRVTILPHDRRI